MRVTVENLGAVKKGTFELKPLTVFVGPNNSGKTWTAYTIGSLFSIGAYNNFMDYYSENQPEEYSFIDNIVKQILDEGHSKINITEIFEKYYKYYLKDLIRLIPSNLPEVLMSSRLNFDTLNINFEIEERFENSLDIIKSWKLENNISVDKNGNAILSCHKEKGDFDLFFITETEGKIKEIPVALIRRFIALQVFQLIHRAFYPNVHFLPSERTGLVQMIGFGALGKVVGDKKREDIDEKINKITFKSSPFSPFGSLFNILWESSDELVKINRLKLAEKNADIKNYTHLAEILEKNILNGSVDVFRKRDGSLHIIYKFKDKEILDLQAASSFVKDLAPLVFYLRFVAMRGDLIVIDEPEMNLHPLAQAQCAEFLGMMINAGLKVIITTHSPYIVEHLSNMIRAEDKATAENISEIEDLLYLKDKNSLLSKDKVSVYLFEYGEITKLLNDSGFINWGTFGNISDELQRIFYNILNMEDV